jgi:uncharacterized protein (TIGR02246 family)
MRRLLLILPLAFVLASCSGLRPADRAAETRLIRDLDQQWKQAIEARDSTRVAGFYAKDALLLPPNGPLVRGEKDIRRWWGAFLRYPNLSLTPAPADLVIADAGDLAYETGAYRLSVDMPQGRVGDLGKTLVVWKKVAGKWRIAAYAYSSDEPLALPSPR